MAAIKLSKGSKINLGKHSDSLERLRFELKWDADASKLKNAGASSKFDADACTFVCKHAQVKDGKGGAITVPKLISNEHFVFYNSGENYTDKVNRCPESAVILSEDETDGGGDGETVTVDVNKLHRETAEVAFTVSIHKWQTRRQNFGQLASGGVDIYNDISGEKIASFEFGTNVFDKETFIHVGSLFRTEDGWEFEPFETGSENTDISDALEKFGADLD